MSTLVCIMRVKLLAFATIFLVALGAVGCKKAKVVAVDPHSAEGVLQALQVQGKLLNDALARKDFGYIHDYAYYFTSLTQALYSRLDDNQKARLRGPLSELSTLSGQLDRAAGGHHAEATEATMQRLTTELKELDAQFREVKKKT
jgi:hypothetical protein